MKSQKFKMKKNMLEIIKDLEEYIGDDKGDPFSWYIGITNDPRTRLFNKYKVKEDKDLWLYRQAESPIIAKKIEDYFIDKKKINSNEHSFDDIVYVYKKRK